MKSIFAVPFTMSIALCALMLSACSSVEYVSNDQLDNMSSYLVAEESPTVLTGNNHQKRMDKHLKRAKGPKQYGALHFKGDEQDIDDEGRLYILKRHNGIYMAETQVSESEERKSFFSFGVNKKKRAAQLGWRVEF